MKYQFKSYAWSIGTTSLRMADIGAKIELQLELLNEFWQQSSVKSKTWKESQEDFYDFLYFKGYVDGSITDSGKKKKTARQKTSGVTDLGLIDSERRLTPAGLDMLKLIQAKKLENIVSDFDIAEDEMIYFKQLIKLSWEPNKNASTVRPFLILGYVLSQCDDYLTYEEFKYLLPLCINEEKTEKIIESISAIRQNKKDIEQTLVEVVLSNNNYKEALKDLLNTNPLTDQTIMDIGMNRDGSKHDFPYVKLFQSLYDVYVNGKHADIYIQRIYDSTKPLTTTGILWRKLLFATKSKKLKYTDMTISEFTKSNREDEFRKCFFKYMHLFKIKSTLRDYFDLNRRYIKMSGIVEFNNSLVQYTPLYKAYFKTDAQKIFDDRYSSSSNMFTNVDIETISPSLKFDAPAIIKAFNTEYGTSYTSLADIKVYIEKQRYDNFDNLVDNVFTDSQLISMIEWFKNRGNDDKKLIKVISDAGGDCEDIPTIFEYVVGVIWYKVSHKQGKVLSYMKLSLDTNQLPRTHAGGFEPDIVYKYPDNLPYYEAHTLLLECTLMESSTQRRGEMEPVTRHLAQYIIEEDSNAYCTFVTPELVLPVISDFRGRKDVYYFPYNKDETKYVESMNIIPIDAIDLTHIVAKNIPYEQIYKLFMDAYNDKEKNPIKWRKNSVALPLENY